MKHQINGQVRYVEEPKGEGKSIKKRGVSGQRVSITLSLFPSVIRGICGFQIRSLFHGSL
jgi:hypothetical protein